jgi:hypothetical protein
MYIIAITACPNMSIILDYIDESLHYQYVARHNMLVCQCNNKPIKLQRIFKLLHK